MEVVGSVGRTKLCLPTYFATLVFTFNATKLMLMFLARDTIAQGCRGVRAMTYAELMQKHAVTKPRTERLVPQKRILSWAMLTRMS